MAKAKHRINNGYGHKTEDDSSKSSRLRTFGLVAIGLFVGYVHQYHVSVLLENDRHFSHLSTLEREMSFRTEMGLYYSYFLTVIEAPTFLQGVEALYSNNVTEYPDTINTLQRFNLYPEIILGGAFRFYDAVARSRNWKTKDCWKINRGENLSPVWSCEGIGDPVYFYLNGVWICAALTMMFTFLLASELSDSILGGLLSVLCYFYNHGECTRVMWTPPLRESFAFPLVVAQMYLVTRVIRNEMTSSRFQVIMLAFTTTLYMAFWQFGQFALFTQVCSLFPIYAVGLMSQKTFGVILNGQMLGLFWSLILLFGNKMLMTSWLSSSLFSSAVILHWSKIPSALKILRSRGEPQTSESEKKEEKALASASNQSVWMLIVFGGLKCLVFLVLTVALKISSGKVLDVKDDDHIMNLLRSKFSDYRDFHTLLYICAKEFDFLGWEMPEKCTKTILIPAVLVVLIILAWNTIQKFNVLDILNCRKPESQSNVEKNLTFADAAVVYNVLQCVAYCAMAVMIMRLKLFFVPQLCLLAALLGNAEFIPYLRENRNWHLAFLVALVASMSVQGISNIKQQRSIIGEYSNEDFEQLIEWINATVPVQASFAGPMPVMANVLLSTRRPVINHPHYEDVGIRRRTKLVYQMYSRRTPAEYHNTLLQLKANYLVISKGWCFNTHMANQCGMTDLYDLEEPERMEANDPLCPILFENRKPIHPFEKLFQNKEYLVLKVSEPVTRGPKSQNKKKKV